MSERRHARETHVDEPPRTDGSTGLIGRRPKSIEEIRTSVSDHLDEMDGSSLLNRLLTARYRRRLFPKAEGSVLDVACGTGTNYQYLPETAEYVGIDISPAMLERAEQRFDRLERGETLREMNAEELAFEADRFDTVITSMSTCMFPDPTKALDEMGRVCDADGTVLLLEHGRSSVGPLARLQDWRAEDRYRKMGCRWNQEPEAVVRQSDLSIQRVESGMLGMITAIEARPE